MLSLPPIHGRFPVGIITFATPVRPARYVGKAKLKNPRNPQLGTGQALQLEEVAFSVYYPADTSSNPPKGLDWLFRPLKYSLLGLATYTGISTWLLWPVVYFFGSLLKIPAYPNAPLLHPTKAQGIVEWPLVVFSHGLGGGRATYSQYCSRLAASGKIVLALEHRDGTSMACEPRSWDADGKRIHRSIVYLRETDVYWEDGQEPKDHPKPWRAEQLMFRHHEIYIMYEAFQKFIEKDLDVELECVDGSLVDRAIWSSLTSAGNPIIRYSEDVLLIGHSFGGATSLSLLATKPSPNYTKIPISKVILLDPWLDPLPRPGPVPYVPASQSHNRVVSTESSGQRLSDGEESPEDDDASLPVSFKGAPRILVINSEAFTLWEDHFTRLQEIMATWEPQGRRITTLIGSAHVSFSDFSVLPILRKKHDLSILNNIVRLSLAFLDDQLDDVLKGEIPTVDMNNQIIGTKPNGNPKKKLTGDIGDVVIS